MQILHFHEYTEKIFVPIYPNMENLPTLKICIQNWHILGLEYYVISGVEYLTSFAIK